MSKYSIILPVYNGGDLLKACVQSILNQTLNDFELIILDNCSTDGTIDFINSLNDERITIIQSDKNIGIVKNWGRILEVKKNEFITLIGHDDILHKNYLEEINNLIELHPNASLYQTHFNYVDAEGKLIRACKPMSLKQTDVEFIACQLSQTIDSMGTGYMMRAADYHKVGGMPQHYPNLIFADYELWVRLSGISYKATSEKCCFDYRVHNSVSKQTNGEAYATAFLLYLQYLKSLLPKESVRKVYQQYLKKFVLYNCESLSHRIFKTPKENRKISVTTFVSNCNALFNSFDLQQNLHPYKKIKILIAALLDTNVVTRNIFLKVLSMYNKKRTQNF